MTLLLDDIEDFLIAQGGVGALIGWPLYKGYMPDDTAQTVGIFETGGYPADTMGRENRPVTFMLRVRGEKFGYAVAHAKWEELFDLLQDANDTGGSPRLLAGYAYIQAMQVGPQFRNDANLRPNFSTNFKVLRTVV